MGNICRSCLGLVYKRRVLKQYTSLDSRAGHDDNAGLFEDDEDGLMTTTSGGSSSIRAVTEDEKLLLKSKNYAAIINSQKAYDEQIDKQLAEQEERLRREEEELIKAKRNRNQMTAKTPTIPRVTPEFPAEGDQEWNTAGGEDDFDMFLESISQRDRAAAEDDEIREEDFVSGFIPS